MSGFTPSEKAKLLNRVAALEAQMSGVAEFIEAIKKHQKACAEKPAKAKARSEKE